MDEDAELEEGEAKEACDPDTDFSYIVWPRELGIVMFYFCVSARGRGWVVFLCEGLVVVVVVPVSDRRVRPFGV